MSSSVLPTLLRPTSGSATVTGYDVVKRSQDVRRSIGYLCPTGRSLRLSRAWPRRGQELFEQLDLLGL